MTSPGEFVKGEVLECEDCWTLVLATSWDRHVKWHDPWAENRDRPRNGLHLVKGPPEGD